MSLLVDSFVKRINVFIAKDVMQLYDLVLSIMLTVVFTEVDL